MSQRLFSVALLALFPLVQADGAPYLANSVKIGEVTAGSALLWTRLTAGERFDPDSYRLPGAAGEARLEFRPAGRQEAGRTLDWVAVNPARDFTHQFELSGLQPDTLYEYELSGRGPGGAVASDRLSGTFRTAPLADEAARVRFTVVTGQEYNTRDDGDRGHKIYPIMLGLKPSFFVHTGDILYYDKGRPLGTNVANARVYWNQMFNLPNLREFHRFVPSYFMKDDHDVLKNDCWPGQVYGELTFAQGQALFLEQVPMGARTYRTFRWGRDLQIWLVEGRDFRSPNNAPDGPDKTIWGREQMAWFEQTVEASDATFRILISPTPVVGPDRGNKNDNHANKGFTWEGDRLRQFLGRQKNLVVICGDRHWQYVSVDPKTGLREYSCGPTTDQHSGGFNLKDRTPMHQYLKICGGFLSATVERLEGRPTLTLRHHAVDGSVNHEEMRAAQ